jgi:hypothetical protein
MVTAATLERLQRQLFDDHTTVSHAPPDSPVEVGRDPRMHSPEYKIEILSSNSYF